MEGNGLSPVHSGRTRNRARGLGAPATLPQKKQREDAQGQTGDWDRTPVVCARTPVGSLGLLSSASTMSLPPGVTVGLRSQAPGWELGRHGTFPASLGDPSWVLLLDGYSQAVVGGQLATQCLCDVSLPAVT